MIDDKYQNTSFTLVFLTCTLIFANQQYTLAKTQMTDFFILQTI